MCCGPRAIDVQSESTSQICALRVSRAAQRVHVWMRGTHAHPREQNIFEKFLLWYCGMFPAIDRRPACAMSSTPTMLATSTHCAGAVCSVHRATRTRTACTPRGTHVQSKQGLGELTQHFSNTKLWVGDAQIGCTHSPPTHSPAFTTSPAAAYSTCAQHLLSTVRHVTKFFDGRIDSYDSPVNLGSL
jgi:hypothetical protein